jgi:hypothetical protein
MNILIKLTCLVGLTLAPLLAKERTLATTIKVESKMETKIVTDDATGAKDTVTTVKYDSTVS